jgi:hypothetical protein
VSKNEEKEAHAKAQRRKEKHSSIKQHSTASRASFAPLRETAFLFKFL